MKIYVCHEDGGQLFGVFVDEIKAKGFAMSRLQKSSALPQISVWDPDAGLLWTEALLQDARGWLWYRSVLCVWKSGHRQFNNVPVPLPETIEAAARIRDADLSFGDSPATIYSPAVSTKMTLVIEGDSAQYVEA